MPQKWKLKDKLFRGDSKSAVRVPTPKADESIVRHIMYFEGAGRETPYLSSSELYDIASRFAGHGGVWTALASDAAGFSVGHLSQSDLLAALKGNGKGKAKWDDPFEVMQARRYVEQWAEHLFDFRNCEDPSSVVLKLFTKP